jgi:hypothetical protein
VALPREKFAGVAGGNEHLVDETTCDAHLCDAIDYIF